MVPITLMVNDLYILEVCFLALDVMQFYGTHYIDG